MKKVEVKFRRLSGIALKCNDRPWRELGEIGVCAGQLSRGGLNHPEFLLLPMRSALVLFRQTVVVTLCVGEDRVRHRTQLLHLSMSASGSCVTSKAYAGNPVR